VDVGQDLFRGDARPGPGYGIFRHYFPFSTCFCFSFSICSCTIL
jgi:hypothetical protein